MLDSEEGVESDRQGTVRVEDYVKGDLSKETNWWGAFVVGLAGTILVTGITGGTLAGLGRGGDPELHLLDDHRLVALHVHRRDGDDAPGPDGRGARLRVLRLQGPAAEASAHINGLTCWMYWLGWMPVMAVNMILIGAYIPVLFGFTDTTATISPFGYPVSWFTIILGTILSLLLFIPAYLGIRFGTGFATVLGLLSMIPLTILALAPFFTGHFHGSNLDGFHYLDTGSFWGKHAFYVYLQFSALLTWNVIAMEAAGLLPGGVSEPGPRRADRHEPRGRVRGVHLHGPAAGRARGAGPDVHHEQRGRHQRDPGGVREDRPQHDGGLAGS